MVVWMPRRSKTTQVNCVKKKSFVIIGLVLACVISISMPVEKAVKYVQEREKNSSPKEETPYSRNPSSEQDSD
jgi:hypothetical protein